MIFYKRIWNCSLRIGRTAQFAAAVYTHKKDDRVDSIYAKPCCDQASSRGKHSNIGNFLWKRKQEKHHYLLCFSMRKGELQKKSILYSWNWKKSMHAKWSQKSKDSLVTKHPLSLWVFVLRSSGVEMLQWLVIFTGYIITSSFSWSLYSALDRMDRLHCPTALENPERCETSFYRIVLAVISKRYSLSNFHQTIKEYSRKVHNTTCFLSLI